MCCAGVNFVLAYAQGNMLVRVVWMVSFCGQFGQITYVIGVNKVPLSGKWAVFLNELNVLHATLHA